MGIPCFLLAAIWSARRKPQKTPIGNMVRVKCPLCKKSPPIIPCILLVYRKDRAITQFAGMEKLSDFLFYLCTVNPISGLPKVLRHHLHAFVSVGMETADSATSFERMTFVAEMYPIVTGVKQIPKNMSVLVFLVFTANGSGHVVSPLQGNYNIGHLLFWRLIERESGAGSRNRTVDLLLTRQSLYQLS